MKLKSFVLALALTAAAAPAADAQRRVGSIYDPSGGPISLIADKTARRPGDLLTVLIRENQELENDEKSQVGRSSTLDYALSSFNIKSDAFNLPLPDIVATSQDDFNGTAKYEKSGTFEARITAIVMDVHPNGNLVIEGRREIRIDRETKVIEFKGIVRRFDVSATNTIESELVAEASVSYIGVGQLTDATNRHGLGGWLHSVFVWLWPF